MKQQIEKLQKLTNTLQAQIVSVKHEIVKGLKSRFADNELSGICEKIKNTISVLESYLPKYERQIKDMQIEVDKYLVQLVEFWEKLVTELVKSSNGHPNEYGSISYTQENLPLSKLKHILDTLS
jgi:hypothetical protein